MKRSDLIFWAALVCLLLPVLRMFLGESNHVDEAEASLERSEIKREVEKEAEEELEDERSSEGLQEELAGIEGVRKVCGEVCDTSVEGGGPVNQGGFKLVRKSINCKDIFQYFSIHDRGMSMLLSNPPSKIPSALSDFYTHNGKVLVGSHYIQDNFRFPSLTRTWTNDSIERNVAVLKRGGIQLKGSYGWRDNKMIVQAIKEALPLDGKRVLVIGSIYPWLESIALAHGAREVVTLEYANIVSQHPQVKAYIPTEFANAYINGSLGAFDVMMTFSSLEHSGLGRYGDGLHPWGDLVTMARSWCVLRDNAMILVGVPSAKRDIIAYNAHRCYGPLLLSQLLANFELTYISHPNLEGLSNPTCVPSKHVVAVAKKIK